VSSSIQTRQIFSIVLLAACLVGVVVLKQRCGAAAGNLFRALDAPLVVDGGAIRDAL
jgi:hypothetical protein